MSSQNTIAIIGSRHFSNIEYIAAVLAELQDTGVPFMIVTGCADGADAIARMTCKSKNIPCHVFEADWHAYGKAAGPMRNAAIAEAAQGCYAFIDKPLKQCRGTLDCINQFTEAGKPVRIFVSLN